jgi:hypothetical protein
MPLGIGRPGKSGAGIVELPDCPGDVDQRLRRDMPGRVWGVCGTTVDVGKAFRAIGEGLQGFGHKMESTRAQVAKEAVDCRRVVPQAAMHGVIDPPGV